MNPYKRNPPSTSKVQHSLSPSTLYIHPVKNSLISYFGHWLDRRRNLHRISSGILFDLLTVVTDLPRIGWGAGRDPLIFDIISCRRLWEWEFLKTKGPPTNQIKQWKAPTTMRGPTLILPWPRLKDRGDQIAAKECYLASLGSEG